MKTVKPDYYDKFICAADRCPCTCCQQWDIYVDAETRRKWKRLEVPEELKTKMASLTECIEGDRIRFGADRRCRLMTESGLCRIVLKHGEENIPHTCHVFPRERHELPGRIEYALSPECPETLRLLWERDHFQLVFEETSGPDERKRYPIQLRDRLLGIMQDPAYASVDTAALLTAFLAILQDAHQKGTGQALPDSDAGELIEAVLSARRNRDEDPEAAAAGWLERNNLLMDSLYEYQDQGRYRDFIDPVMEMAERYGAADADRGADGRPDQENAQEPYLRRLFEEEIYSSLLPSAETADYDIIYFMIVKLEWLIMACSNIRQCLALRRIGGFPCDTEDLTETVVILMRIMGFADDDIMEYMESEFEDAVWPLGYAMLLN